MPSDLIRGGRRFASRNASRKKRQIGRGTSARAGRFPAWHIKRALLLSCVLMAVSGVAGAQAPPGPTTPPAANRAAIARTRRQLRADAAGAAFRHGGSGGNDHRPAGRAARRQTGPLRWRVVPAAGRRPRNARACAGHRQDARDSAARQPRRRPDNPAEIALFCRYLAGRAGLLDRPRAHFLYAARSRLRHTCAVTVNRGEVAQLVRARES